MSELRMGGGRGLPRARNLFSLFRLSLSRLSLSLSGCRGKAPSIRTAGHQVPNLSDFPLPYLQNPPIPLRYCLL